jgi:hypothetical protein
MDVRDSRNAVAAGVSVCRFGDVMLGGIIDFTRRSFRPQADGSKWFGVCRNKREKDDNQDNEAAYEWHE